MRIDQRPGSIGGYGILRQAQQDLMEIRIQAARMTLDNKIIYQKRNRKV